MNLEEEYKSLKKVFPELEKERKINQFV